MSLFWRKATVVIASLVMLLAYAAVAQTPATSKSGASAGQARRKTSHAAGLKRGVSKPSPVPPAPQPPPPPPTPEQMPPVPPQVSYSNGLLTIVANNSTLSDVLRAVAARIGATIDAPPQLGAERVAARIGPGTPRDVMTDLLNGPGFDYILVGADGDPNAVRSIILTANRSSSSAGTAVTQGQPARTVTPPQEEIEDEATGEGQFQPENPQPPPGPPAQQSSTPQPPFGQQLPPDQTGGAQPPFRGGVGQQPQIKTPEQLLEDLRRMQQQGNQPQNEPRR